MTHRIRWRNTDVPSVRDYHLTVSTSRALGGLSLRERLNSITGVEMVIVGEKYRVRIFKGQAFDWDEVDPEVIRVLRMHFDGRAEDVLVEEIQDISQKLEISTLFSRLFDQDVKKIGRAGGMDDIRQQGHEARD